MNAVARPADGWHALPAAEVVARLGTDPVRGLDGGQTAGRLASDGPNAIRRGERLSAWTVLGRQFQSLVIWVLIAAALVAARARASGPTASRSSPSWS